MWFKAPWPVFDDPGVDGYFMDDGARSERFAPLFANSGFYFLRATPMVQHFMQTVMFRSACVMCIYRYVCLPHDVTPNHTYTPQHPNPPPDTATT